METLNLGTRTKRTSQPSRPDSSQADQAMAEWSLLRTGIFYSGGPCRFARSDRANPSSPSRAKLLDLYLIVSACTACSALGHPTMTCELPKTVPSEYPITRMHLPAPGNRQTTPSFLGSRASTTLSRRRAFYQTVVTRSLTRPVLFASLHRFFLSSVLYA